MWSCTLFPVPRQDLVFNMTEKIEVTEEEQKYRFDSQTREVYELMDDKHAYIYIGSYLIFGLRPGMSYEIKVKRVESVRYQQELDGRGD